MPETMRKQRYNLLNLLFILKGASIAPSENVDGRCLGLQHHLLQHTHGGEPMSG